MREDQIEQLKEKARIRSGVQDIFKKVNKAFNGHDIITCSTAATNLCLYIIDQLPAGERLDMASGMAAEILERSRQSIRRPDEPGPLPGLGKTRIDE